MKNEYLITVFPIFCCHFPSDNTQWSKTQMEHNIMTVILPFSFISTNHSKFEKNFIIFMLLWTHKTVDTQQQYHRELFYCIQTKFAFLFMDFNFFLIFILLPSFYVRLSELFSIKSPCIFVEIDEWPKYKHAIAL